MRDKNKLRPARSLTFTLAVALLGMSTVILVINGAMAVYTNYLALRETVSLGLQLDARTAGDVVAVSIQEKISALETSAEFADPTRATTPEQQTVLENLLALQPAFRQLALLNTSGRPVAQISRLSSALLPQFQDQFKGDVLTVTGQGQSYISPVYIDETTSEPLALISVPIQDVFGDFQGVLAAEMNLKFMWELIDQMQVGETGYAFAVDNQGKLIAFGDITRVLAGEDVSQNFEVREFLQNPSAAEDITPDIEMHTGLVGTTVAGYYEPLGTPNWAVVVELPRDEAFRPLVQSLITSIATIVGFAIFAGVMGVIMARRLSAPLVDLARVAGEIAGGNLTAEAKSTGPAEILQLASTFNLMTTRLRDLISSLEQRVADRTKALAASAEVSRRLSTILDQGQLVKEVVEQVQSAFHYYHAHIYLLNAAGDELVMAGGTGEAGQTMLARGHKISRGKGLVGGAADANTSVLVPDTSSNPDWLPNPLLPNTKSEIAVPISIGGQVLGVLDVQHNVAGGLNQDDADLLQSIANQVAVALQNIKQYENTQKIAADMGVIANVGITTSTITEPGHLLQEVVDLSKKSFNLYHAHIYLLNEAGDSLALSSGAGEVGRQMVSETRSIPLDSEQSLVARAARTREGVVVNDVTAAPDFLPNPLLPDTRSEMAVPMIVAGKVIGVLDVQSERVNRFTDVDVSIQTTLASQVAVALQNARSFARAQKQAKQESMLNAISQKIQGATTIEAALQTAARELGHALGMKPTLVALKPESLLADAKNKN